MIDQSVHGVNRPFVLSFKKVADRTIHKMYFLPTVKIIQPAK